MSDAPAYVLERRFDAAPDLVWRAWTEPEYLAHWYGPGVETIVHRLDVAPGGLWLNEMKWSGQSHYQRAEYTEVQRPERLVFLLSAADADWNVIANPMMPDWPRVLLTTVTFEANGDATDMRLEWQPHDATEKERAVFSASVAQAGQGWGRGMDLLDGLLTEMQAGS